MSTGASAFRELASLFSDHNRTASRLNNGAAFSRFDRDKPQLVVLGARCRVPKSYGRVAMGRIGVGLAVLAIYATELDDVLDLVELYAPETGRPRESIVEERTPYRMQLGIVSC
jgi:hypothetical protein